jgi:hypothetical protein
MQQQAVVLLRWLQPLLKVARIRSMACDIVLLSPEELATALQQPQQPPQQQQQVPPWQQQQQLEHVQSQLWAVAQSLVSQLAPANAAFTCRAAQQQGCLLCRLLLLLPSMAPNIHDPKGQLLTEAVTLLLLMLYDSQFKYDTTTHLLDCYSWLLQLVGSAREDAVADALSAALDRLTVQLFNSEEVRLLH